MTTKHTPGPWHQGDSDRLAIHAESGLLVCGIYAARITPIQARANASLIAAAPELRAFVEWFAAKDHEERGRMLLKCMGWDPKNAEGPQDFAKRYAQAAIAKAEGRA